MSQFKEMKLSGSEIFNGKLLHVFKDEVKLPTGKTSTREYIKHQGAAVIIPLHQGKIVMVKQYRYPLHQTMLELPAGKIDPGEDETTTIKRELGEETGYTSNKIFKLQPIHPCIGYSDEIIHIFISTALKTSQLTPDENETIEVVQLSLEEALEKIYCGEITDAKTVIGLFWAEKLLSDENLRNRFGVHL